MILVQSVLGTLHQDPGRIGLELYFINLLKKGGININITL